MYRKVFEQCEKENILANSGRENLLLNCDNYCQKVEALLGYLACKDFSFAAHALTGWTVIEYGVDLDSVSPWYHSVCKVPDSDLFLDVKGMRTEQEILAEYANPEDEDSYYAVDVDPEPYHLMDTKPLEQLAAFLIDRDSYKLVK
jgi:hypothetical protein